MKNIVELIRKAGRHLFLNKQELELSYWKDIYKKENHSFNNDFYAKLMLAISEESNDGFLSEKVVGDFGCGPRGSLTWAKPAAQRIGIDVLAQEYIRNFPSEYLKHKTIYVTSTESAIPLPDGVLDILFTVNALDHVANLPTICAELRRIVKPGGLIIGSFNLNHRPTKAEPQRMTEDILKILLFKDYEILSWRVSAPEKSNPQKSLYNPFYINQLIDPHGKEAFLWAKVCKLK